MSKPYLEITYRQGKAFAAYLYLDRRPGDASTRTERHGNWIVDYAHDGRAIGIEILDCNVAVDVAAVNRILATTNQPAVAASDLEPLRAA